MNQLSFTNRRIVLVAVLSLVASLLAVNFNAPAARRPPAEAIEFTSLTGTIGESDVSTTVEITLDATEDNLVENTSVAISANGGTASGPSTDYTYSTTIVTFTAGTALPASETVTVLINSDSDHEPDETIIFGLSNQTAGTDITSGNTTHTLTITDDDDAEVAFTNT